MRRVRIGNQEFFHEVSPIRRVVGVEMILEGGPHCDVCDHYILLDKSINPFSVPGIKQQLHCHDKCVEIVKEAFLKKDYTLLPEARLRRALEEADKNGILKK